MKKNYTVEYIPSKDKVKQLNESFMNKIIHIKSNIIIYITALSIWREASECFWDRSDIVKISCYIRVKYFPNTMLKLTNGKQENSIIIHSFVYVFIYQIFVEITHEPTTTKKKISSWHLPVKLRDKITSSLKM